MSERFHELILFADHNFEGSHRHVFRSMAYLGDIAFNDVTSSFVVLSGAWKFYKGHNFEIAQGSVFTPRLRGYDWIADYDVSNDELSSVALIEDASRHVPHVIAFSGASFGGEHRHIVRDLSSDDLHDASSLAVFWGHWRLTDADGHTADVLPALYPDIATLGLTRGRLQSVTLLDVSGEPRTPMPHLIAFVDAKFGGDHRHIVQDEPRLGGGWDQSISSLAVERGTWRMYVDQDYAGPALGPVFSRGLYSYVEDFDVWNDKVRAVRQEQLPVHPTLVSDANICDGTNILTAHGDNYRLGWNRHETELTPENVRLPQFGQIWSTNLPGQDGKPARVYGQPLYVSNVLCRDGVKRDLVIFATASNDVAALHAATGVVEWWTHLGEPGNALTDHEFDQYLRNGVSHVGTPCHNTSPLHGVNSTPVIDPTGSVVYVAYLAKGSAEYTYENDYNQAYWLQAVNVSDGSLAWGVELKGSVQRPDGSSLRFKPFVHTQRAALTYQRQNADIGFVLVPFSSRCDLVSDRNDDWQGWIFAVQVINARRAGVVLTFATALDDKGLTGCGGIWGTAGLSVDDQQNIYAATGNGPFDGANHKWADSVIRLHPFGTVNNSYTPINHEALAGSDLDLGGASPVLLPPQSLGPQDRGNVPSTNVIVTGGKDGRLYFLNGDDLGGLGHALWKPPIFPSGSDPYTSGIAITPAYFDAGPAGRFVYVCSGGSGDFKGLAAAHFDDLNGETMLGIRLIQFEGEGFSGAPGAPFVSSNGPNDGIVWVVDSFRLQEDNGEDSILRAWDAVSGRLLYSSPKTAAQKLGDGRKFVGLCVIKGRVFVPAAGIVCYGLDPEDVDD